MSKNLLQFPRQVRHLMQYGAYSLKEGITQLPVCTVHRCGNVSLSLPVGRPLTMQHPRDDLRDLDMKAQGCCLLGAGLQVPQDGGHVLIIHRSRRPDQRRELAVENVYRPPDLSTPFDALLTELLDRKSAMQTFHQGHTHGMTNLRSSVVAYGW